MAFSVTLQCVHTGHTDQIQSDLIYTHSFPGLVSHYFRSRFAAMCMAWSWKPASEDQRMKKGHTQGQKIWGWAGCAYLMEYTIYANPET